MLAYLLWHSPRDEDAAADYETALAAFHRSLARRPPVGMLGSAAFRLRALPWQHGGNTGAGASAHYEDWYLVEDFAALGVLNEAAVGRGHRTAHDRAARHYRIGAGGLYALQEGRREADLLAGATTAVWVARPAGCEPSGLDQLLGDGLDPDSSSLWRRQLVLGPAPEFCLLTASVPNGMAPTRLPDGWTVATAEREVVWHG